MRDVKPVTIIGEESFDIGPLNIKRLELQEAVQLIRSAVISRNQLSVAICNAHSVLTAIDDPKYAQTLNKMTLLNDGIGIGLASRFLHGANFPANLNGTDLVPHILGEVGRPLRIYLLGAKETQVLLTKEHIEHAYPMHEVVGYRDGYFNMDDCTDVCSAVSAASPDLLLVAMGNPRQEEFIMQNRCRLNATVAIGVGALFDFMSGSVVRAPKVVQMVGLEWLFRLLQEPSRLYRRYVIGIPRFFFEVARIRFAQAHRAD